MLDKLESKRLEKTKSSSEKPKSSSNFLQIGAGSMFSSMVISGFVVGYVLDMLLGTAPLFLLGCGVLGFVGGMMKVQKLFECEGHNAGPQDESEALEAKKGGNASQ